MFFTRMDQFYLPAEHLTDHNSFHWEVYSSVDKRVIRGYSLKNYAHISNAFVLALVYVKLAPDRRLSKR